MKTYALASNALLLILMFCTSSCSEPEPGRLSLNVEDSAIKKEAIGWKLHKKKQFQGRYLGTNQDRTVFFVCDYDEPQATEGVFHLQARDLNTSEIRRTIRLRTGEPLHPDEFRKPIRGSADYLNGHYWVNQEKLAVFSEKGLFKHSTMYQSSNQQNLSLFLFRGEEHFLLCDMKEVEKEKLTYYQYSVSIHKVEHQEKCFLVKTIETFPEIDFTIPSKILYITPSERKSVIHYFCPHLFGFTQQNKIVYTLNSQNCYFVYDLMTGSKTKYELSYNHDTENYSDDDAKKMALYGGSKELEEQSKKRGFSREYKTYKGPTIYFLWMLNAGDDVLAFVKNLDTEEWTIKVDFFKIDAGKLLESVTLPVGAHFLDSLSVLQGTTPTLFLDYAKKIYIFGDIDSDTSEDCVRMYEFQ